MSIPTVLTLLIFCFSAFTAQAAPGDYDPAYGQSGGYGAATLDERVGKLEKKLSGNNQTETINLVEQLQAEVQRQRGEIEDLSHRLDVMKKQQKDLYQDLDRKIQALAAPPPAPATPAPEPAAPAQEPAPPPPVPVTPVPVVPKPTPPPAPAIPVPAPPKVVLPPVTAAPEQPKPPPVSATPKPLPPAVAPSADSAARQAAYQKGFNKMQEEKYSEAAKEFKSFLSTYPKGEYSDNAAYWLAEAQYVNRDLAAARDSFKRLIKDYPQGGKLADAQLKLGYIDYDSGQWANAKTNLDEVIKRYPATSAAKLAQKRLDKIKLEGH